MSPPRYPTVRVPVDAADVEGVSARLFALGASGLEQRDVTTLARADGIELVAHFETEAEARAAAAALGAPAEVDFVVGDDWKTEWKKFFRPARVGRRFVVRPPWEPWEASPDDLVITIDPGAAFGTGTHETTRLCLVEIERLACSGAVLDVGCGSGILGIAAALAGASRVLAIDVDPVAARVAGENAAVNGVRLEASTRPVHALDERFGLVLANIRAPVLCAMVEPLCARVAGHLVLSGILASEQGEVRAAFDPVLLFERVTADGEWVALTYRTAS